MRERQKKGVIMKVLNGWFLAILLSYFASSSLSSLVNQSFVYHPVIWLGGGVSLIALLTLEPSKRVTAWILFATGIGSVLAHEWGLMIAKQEINTQTYLLNAVGLGLAEVIQVYLIYKLIILFKVDYKNLVNLKDVFYFFVGAILTGTCVGLGLKSGLVSLHWEVFGKGIVTTEYYSWFIAELLSVFVSSILLLSIYYTRVGEGLWRKRLLEVCLPVVITYFFVSVLSIIACPSEREGAYIAQSLMLNYEQVVSGCRIAGAGVAFNFMLLVTLLLLSGRAFVSENAIKRNATEVNDINRKLNDTLQSSWLMNSDLMTQKKIADIAANTSFQIANIEFVVVGIAGHCGAQFFSYSARSVPSSEHAADREIIAHNEGICTGANSTTDFYAGMAAKTKELSSLDVNMYPDESVAKGFITVYYQAHRTISINDIALLKTIAFSAGVATLNLTMLLNEKENSSRLMQSDTVISTASEGIFIADPNLKVTTINPSFSEISGYHKKDVMGEFLYRLACYKVDRHFLHEIRQDIELHGRWAGELIDCRHKEGGLFSIRLSITAVNDGSGKPFYAGVFSDITRFKENSERLQYQADHDDLTGLANRKRFNNELQAVLENAGRESDRCAVLYLDLDKFKQVNDNMGHQAGDNLLQQVAERLRGCVRGSDLISRLGGDEFAILLKMINSKKAAERVAENILTSLNLPFQIGESSAFISCSIGMSVFPDHARDHVELLTYADSAMYEAKRDGRNGFKFYAQEMSEKEAERYEIETGLRCAFDNDELELYYQPQADIRDNKLVGLEALIRWNHPERGTIAPGEFLDVAKEGGFMRQLDDWVLNEGFAQLKTWQQEGIAPERLSLNISGVQITDYDFVEQLKALIDKYKISPDGIELEISENFIMIHAIKAIEVLNEIRKLGFHLSIDDFGTGYSSLSYLKKLPIDTLKIDGSFVRDVIDDQDDASIAIAIITLAHNMRMRVIAEGVETNGQRDFLLKNNSDIYQGYLLSRPVNSEGIRPFLLKNDKTGKKHEHDEH